MARSTDSSSRQISFDDGLPELFTARQWTRLEAKLALSRRQVDIARLICRGLDRNEIGELLHLSPHTVRMHMRNLYTTLNVRSRVGVIVRLVIADRRLARSHKGR